MKKRMYATLMIVMIILSPLLACDGTAYVCESEMGQAIQDFEENCSPGDSLTIIEIEGC